MANLEEVERRRAERKAKLETERVSQRALDLEAIDALEVELGDANVAVVDVPFDGGVTCAAVRTASPAEVKRYQDKVRPRGSDGALGDTAKAAEQVGRACTVYPVDEARDTLFIARPAVVAQLGLEALRLARGTAQAEGNA